MHFWIFTTIPPEHSGEAFSDHGVSLHVSDRGLFGSPSHGSEVWSLERPSHRSDDQTCKSGRQHQPRKLRDLRGWKHTDRQDVRPEHPHWIDVGTCRADAGTLLDRRRRICLFILTKSSTRGNAEGRGTASNAPEENRSEETDHALGVALERDFTVAILLTDRTAGNAQLGAGLAHVGSLPILLRNILAARKLEPHGSRWWLIHSQVVGSVRADLHRASSGMCPMGRSAC